METLEIKDKLIAMRVAKGYSKRTVSEMTGIPYTTYTKYESGERKDVSMIALCKLADFYGVTTDYLLGRGEPVEPPNPINQLPIDDADKLIVQAYINLQPKERTTFVEIIKKIAAGADVDIVTSNGIEQETYPVQTAARRGVNGEHSPITTEYLAAAEIEDIINAEDGDDDL